MVFFMIDYPKRNMNVISRISRFAILAIFGAYLGLTPSRASTVRIVQQVSPVAKVDAERIAVSSFKRHTRGKVKNFSWRFVYFNDDEWVFTFDDLDVIPGPGTDYFVSVQKASGRVRIDRGM